MDLEIKICKGDRRIYAMNNIERKNRDEIFQLIYEDDKRMRRLKKANKFTIFVVCVALGVLIVSLVGNVY